MIGTRADRWPRTWEVGQWVLCSLSHRLSKPSVRASAGGLWSQYVSNVIEKLNVLDASR